MDKQQQKTSELYLHMTMHLDGRVATLYVNSKECSERSSSVVGSLFGRYQRHPRVLLLGESCSSRSLNQGPFGRPVLSLLLVLVTTLKWSVAAAPNQ